MCFFYTTKFMNMPLKQVFGVYWVPKNEGENC